VLAQEPDLLRLDEPTNHLDIETVSWLEAALLAFRGAVVMVTHDRWFLNQVALRIVALRGGALRSYPGTFQDYLTQRLEDDALDRRLAAQRRDLLAKELDWLGRSPAARSTRPKARLERARALIAERVEVERPLQLPDFAVERLGKTVLEARGLTVGHPGGPVVCADLDLTLARGERLVIVGRNGAGKTTLLRTLLGDLPPLAGSVRLGQNTQPMWIDQQRSGLDPEQTLRQAAALGGGDVVEVGGVRQHVAAWLGQLLFRPEDLDQKVGSLSGGQRFRLLLGRKLQEPANLLVLDEPTNDLDLETLGVLEASLERWRGCALIVSHDRAFVDRIATGLLHVEVGAAGGAGVVTRTAGGWAQLLALRGAAAEAAREAQREERLAQRAARAAGGGAGEGAAEEARAPAKPTWGEERRLAGIEAEIEAAEAELARREAALGDPALASDHLALAAAAAAQAAQAAIVAALWEDWQALERKAEAWAAWQAARRR
jgi:ATP-binding cassette subfamily F protein uup